MKAESHSNVYNLNGKENASLMVATKNIVETCLDIIKYDDKTNIEDLEIKFGKFLSFGKFIEVTEEVYFTQKSQ